MAIKNQKEARRQKIRYRIRKKVSGTSERPRLSIFKSNRSFYVQLVDDTQGHTLLSMNSKEQGGRNKAQVTEMGRLFAEKIKEKGIKRVLPDRSGYLYHGVVKAFFDAVMNSTNHGT